MGAIPCGIRRSSDAVRYRLEQADILDCCREGYALGFRTFVLQSGEDPWYTDARMTAIISAIRRDWYKNDMSALETAAECLLEMEKSHAETKSEH